MNKLEAFLNKYIMPMTEFFNTNTELVAIKDGMVRVMPLTIIGSLFLLIYNLPYLAEYAPGLQANLAAFFAGIKTRIAHAHTTFDQSDSFKRKLYIKVMRFIVNTFSTHLLACSKQSGHYLFGRKHIMKENYAFFPNVIDYSNFLHTSDIDVKKFKLKEGLGNSHIVIGHIGTFKESKNQSFLVDIMATFIERNLKVNLLLIGDGELKQTIQADVQQKGLTNYVKFLGIRSNISTILHSMDVFVFPSIYEGLGLVLLEAQASGIPCVVSEAIQPEADLGLGLVNKIPLDAGLHVWTEKIVN